MRKVFLALVGTGLFLSGCSDGNGPAGSVAIKFGTPPISAAAASNTSFSMVGAATDGQLHVRGDNGRLDISEIRVIVEEFELDPVEVAGCNDDLGGDCPKFEQRYLFINVPINDEPVTVVNGGIPTDQYDGLEFEVDDVEVDDDDPEDLADAALIEALFATVRESFPTWPEKASMVVVGTFNPAVGDPVDFTTFFEAEIEVELDFDMPLSITEETSEVVIVRLRPDIWFTRGDGTVWDLASLQNQLVQFELEMEEGFELEVETN